MLIFQNSGNSALPDRYICAVRHEWWHHRAAASMGLCRALLQQEPQLNELALCARIWATAFGQLLEGWPEQEKFLLLRRQGAKRPAITKQCADRASQAFLMGNVSLCSNPCVMGSIVGRPGPCRAVGIAFESLSLKLGSVPHRSVQGTKESSEHSLSSASGLQQQGLPSPLFCSNIPKWLLLFRYFLKCTSERYDFYF